MTSIIRDEHLIFGRDRVNVYAMSDGTVTVHVVAFAGEIAEEDASLNLTNVEGCRLRDALDSALDAARDAIIKSRTEAESERARAIVEEVWPIASIEELIAIEEVDGDE